MEKITTSEEGGNAIARTVARKIIEQAHQIEREEGVDLDESTGSTDEEEQDNWFLDEEDDHNSYDSDDPRSFGGTYYWDIDNGMNHITLVRKCKDLLRLSLFHVIRVLGFILLVVQHFFGLNRSRFQWAVDLVEQERARRDEAVLSGRFTRLK